MPDAPNTTLAATPLLTTEEVAQQLALSPETLETWRYTGRNALPYLKVGRLVRYRQGDVSAFVEGCQCAA